MTEETPLADENAVVSESVSADRSVEVDDATPEAEQVETPAKRMRSRALVVSAIVTAVVAAVALAGVLMFRPAKSETQTEQSRHQELRVRQARTLLSQAQVARGSGNTTAAGEFAAQAAAIDPSNKEAKALAERIRRQLQQEADARANEAEPKPAPQPAPNGNSGTQTSQGAASTASESGAWDTGWESQVASVTPLLPKSFPDWAMGAVMRSRTDPFVTAEPWSRTSKSTRIRWTIHEVTDSAAADAWVTSRSRMEYAKNPSTVDVDGAPGYFGTNGAHDASVTYARGRYVFDVVVTAAKGVKPKSLKAIALAAARRFADTPTPGQ